MILPESFPDAIDAHLNISLVYGLDDMKDINEWNITPCLLYVKGEQDRYLKEGNFSKILNSNFNCPQ